MLDEDEFFSEHGIRSFVSFAIACSSFLVTHGIPHSDFQNGTKIIPGVWTLMENVTKSATGPGTLGLVCSVVTQIGEGLYVRYIPSSTLRLEC